MTEHISIIIYKLSDSHVLVQGRPVRALCDA